MNAICLLEDAHSILSDTHVHHADYLMK